MAVTAVLSVNESSVNSRQSAKFVLVLTNDGGSDVTVSSIAITAEPNQSAVLTVPAFSPSNSRTISASGGTLTATCGGYFIANYITDENSDTEQTAFEVVAYVALSDGTSATSNTVTMQVTPIFEPTIAMPVEGQFRFDSNNNSALLAVL